MPLITSISEGVRHCPKALVTRAVERIAELPSLRPDIAAEDQSVTSSICQFDILAVLAIIAATHDRSGGGWYPNFARFYTVRSEPAVQQLIKEADMRAVLFPLPNADLAAALREIDRMSRSEGSRFAGGTDSTPRRSRSSSRKTGLTLRRRRVALAVRAESYTCEAAPGLPTTFPIAS